MERVRLKLKSYCSKANGPRLKAVLIGELQMCTKPHHLNLLLLTVQSEEWGVFLGCMLRKWNLSGTLMSDIIKLIDR